MCFPKFLDIQTTTEITCKPKLRLNYPSYVENPTTRVKLNGQILTPLGYLWMLLGPHERYEKHTRKFIPQKKLASELLTPRNTPGEPAQGFR